ncbi:MAG: fibronectin type III domain-containing protein [Bacteroidota bacterium]
MGKQVVSEEKVKPTRPLVIEEMPSKDNDLITYAHGKINLFTSSTWITSPIPTILVVTGLLGTYSTAQSKVSQRTIGLASERDLAKLPVESALHCWAALVQWTADQNPLQAIAIIEAHGYRTQKVYVSSKKDFEARHDVSGTVNLIIKSKGPHTYYERQMSTDGHTWTEIEGTMHCKYLLKGLTPGTAYYFRYRATTGAGKSDWSQYIYFMAI